MSLQWQVPPEHLANNVGDWLDRFMGAAVVLGADWAQQLEGEAKANAPWQDRTGHARQGLTGKAYVEDTALIIVLMHMMDYGIWLEVAHAGTYAIIMKTLLAHFQEIMDEMRALAGSV